MGSELLDNVVEVVAGLWLVYVSITVAGGVAYFLYKPRKSLFKSTNYEIVVVSKADEKVKNSLLEVVRYHLKKFGKLTVVIDEGAPLTNTLKSIRSLNLVIVPASYRRDLVGKGRALSYFIENQVDDEKWYVFIDDDNLILDESFLYEIPYYEEKGFAAGNGILLPRPGRSKIAYVMDWIRYVDDLTLYRFFTGLVSRPLLGLHGELLIVKGRVLREVGFTFKSITEDFRFATELIKKGYKTWQSGTRVSIKSPNSLRDLVKQRGRWFKGMLSDIKYSPVPMKLIVGFRSVIWSFNFVSTLLIGPLLAYMGLIWVLIPGSLYYLTSYTYGVYRSGKPYMLLLVPFFGFIEASSRVYGLINVNDFVVIDKN
ncbi:glycosyltransferase family 2 protein [Thermosphaera chiliense]|uniref:Glycosyltransferase family 2 protein n=1 Tax=Thermosphaera chiliense TaxID=3402707 RepID=A0A7M1UP71_9CREN|nr:glycosyltransferase family 2 protein [Thermosphaera aggregans]QOR94040.1 glycosyltransferase family 2 protein [Thermosphaera aggregans]